MSAEERLKNILFIDDDPQVLRGLELSLRAEARRWRMVFARGSENALAVMMRMQFDVVVSDMRMPGTDGAGLLAFVRQRFPQTARIVLSGHAEQAAVERALSTAHVFLSKPCPTHQLRSEIEKLLITSAAERDEITQRRTTQRLAALGR